MWECHKNPSKLPEKLIDRNLESAGWIIQDRAEMNLYAGLGVAVSAFPTKNLMGDPGKKSLEDL